MGKNEDGLQQNMIASPWQYTTVFYISCQAPGVSECMQVPTLKLQTPVQPVQSTVHLYTGGTWTTEMISGGGVIKVKT